MTKLQATGFLPLDFYHLEELKRLDARALEVL